MSAQSDAFHIYYWNREDETLDCVALGMSMGIEEIVDKETNAKNHSHSRLLHVHVHRTRGLDTPAWLTVSQLSTRNTPSFWFCVSFLALLLRDVDADATNPSPACLLLFPGPYGVR